MPENKSIIKSENGGTVSYSEDVIAVISGIAASEVEGVAGMCGDIKSGIASLLGKSDMSKGIKATVTDNEEASVEVNLIAEYGATIPEVAAEVQKNVRHALEEMTGLRVSGIHVNVQGIRIPKEENK